MNIAGYEPHSGWNLPARLLRGRPERAVEPGGAGAVLRVQVVQSRPMATTACAALELEAAIANEELAGASMADTANKSVDWALDHLRDGGEIACEHFKP